ncbi:hypothetical protein Nepgr_031574 [Nepenthes gracilis]|uniref:Pentatricopeptide repeat-containing protein n=1 Tax=Nepenthes gracilis TaxID=150966 RepID=A0AAD3Y7M6_NEPGR|nr:hypothetical protein Nepgr_031574 [Nepenthes gracilis]
MTMLVCCYSPPIPIRSFTDIVASIFELQQAHAYMIKTKLINDTFAASRLVAFAATNSDLPTIAYAHSIFSRIKYPNAYIWNVMIRAYASSPDPVHALLIFNQMLHSCGVVPDKYTYPFVLKACSGVGGLGEGRQVHGHAVKRGIKADIYVYNSLISMYARSGCFDIARKLLDKMLLRDVISWNALLSGYVDKGLMGSAQQLFDEMEERNAESWNFLISGYVKAGLIEEARKLFDEMNVKNVVSWNSLMTGVCSC